MLMMTKGVKLNNIITGCCGEAFDTVTPAHLEHDFFLLNEQEVHMLKCHVVGFFVAHIFPHVSC